jgi:hypothetical protein
MIPVIQLEKRTATCKYGAPNLMADVRLKNFWRYPIAQFFLATLVLNRGNLDIKEAVFRNSSYEKLGLGCAPSGRFSDSIGWLPSAP